jgi:DNA (cytosine-5)-methyltransferase 1
MQPILTHGSLFSGIGGFDLAAEWMGWQNLFHCEWNPFGQRVLKHYWPNAESFHDITKSNFTHYANRIDVLTGGFPCQPYSSAGKRLGKEDERHLWPEMLRVISKISPRFIVGENVRGISNWNDGVVFDEVCADLENLGYQVAPVIIPACGVNAPHRRERVWFVAKRISANPNRNGCHQCHGEYEEQSSEGGQHAQCNTYEVCSNAANANSNGLQGWINKEKSQTPNEQIITRNAQRDTRQTWDNFPTQSPIFGRNDGVPNGLDGIAFSKWRNESVKAYGNAIVPQVAYQIFKAIEAAAAECENIVSL